jgi:hypothetical protein
MKARGIEPTDLQELRLVRPYLRSTLAFMLYLRYPLRDKEQCYKDADEFIDKLHREVEEANAAR